MKFKSIVTTKLFLTIIIISVLLNVVFLLRFKYQKITYKNEYLISERRLATLESLNEKFRDMILNISGSESAPINPDLILTDAITNRQISIAEIAKNSPVLILRFTEYSCHACIEQSFRVMNDMPHPFREGKFIIIASYENIRDLLLFKRDNNINYPIYLPGNDTLTVPLESLNFPYFFILNTEIKASNIYYPLTSYPELTEDYFLVLKHRYPILFR